MSLLLPVTGTQRQGRRSTLPFSAYTRRVTWTGQRLRDARAQAGITSQQEAAARIGVSVRAYAAWERDEAKPQAHWIPKLDALFADTPHPADRLDQATIERALDEASFLDLLAAVARKHARLAKQDTNQPDLPAGRFVFRAEDAPSARRPRPNPSPRDQPDEQGGQVL